MYGGLPWTRSKGSTHKPSPARHNIPIFHSSYLFSLPCCFGGGAFVLQHPGPFPRTPVFGMEIIDMSLNVKSMSLNVKSPGRCSRGISVSTRIYDIVNGVPVDAWNIGIMICCPMRRLYGFTPGFACISSVVDIPCIIAIEWKVSPGLIV